MMCTHKVMSVDPFSLASWGNISAFMAQGSGPNPIENAAMNTIKETRGSQPMSSTVPGSILESGLQFVVINPVQFLFSSK